MSEAPPITIRSTERENGVTVVDLAFATGQDEGSADAYLVLPAVSRRGPGVLFFHWLEGGSPTSNRTEFLAEARELGGRGVVSLLVDGTFPWRKRPRSAVHDRAAIEAELVMVRRGRDLLASRPEVDPRRMALVGHDFGAMYSTLLFAEDPRLAGMVMMAPTARWGDWFLEYWQMPDVEADYLRSMAPLDPVAQLRRVGGRPILLQFGSEDEYVPEEVATEIHRAAGPAARAITYQAGHQLHAPARADRVAWLEQLLGF